MESYEAEMERDGNREMISEGAVARAPPCLSLVLRWPCCVTIHTGIQSLRHSLRDSDFGQFLP